MTDKPEKREEENVPSPQQRTLVDLLRQDDPGADFDFQPEPLSGPLTRPVNLSED